ncbi:MAG: Ig-like domain-containing protein [Massilia sp.]
MNAINRNNIYLLSAIATLIAGCGGGDNTTFSNLPATPSAIAPASITAAADARSVDWNTASTIDVLANDSASRGPLTLTAVAGAQHGAAVVSNGKIVYTPAAGFYGVEKLNYTVGADGGATATAEATITVEAVMTLNGNASDNPINGGTVTASIGGRSFQAPTNASGDYSLTLRSSSPADFVTLVAAGAGNQAPVKLASLVGDVATLAKSTSSAGQVSMTAVPGLGVTHITSAFMALATKSNGGVAPSTAQQLRDVAPKVDVDDVMRLATAIKLTADKGVPLPAGVSDTLAMVNSDASVNAVYTAANVINPTLATDTRAAVVTSVTAPAGVFSLDGLAERTSVYRDFTITYRADGTGYMSGRYGDHNLTWKADGALVNIVYEKPTQYDYAVGDGVNIGGVPVPDSIRENTVGMQILKVINDATVKWGEIGTVVWTSGPNAGKSVSGTNLTTTNAPITLSTAFNVDQRLPIPSSMTSVGAVIAGVFANPQPTFDTTSNPGTAYLQPIAQSTDALQITSATEARFMLSGAVVNWSVTDNYLVIQDKAAGSVSWKMALLGVNASNGQSQWVATADKFRMPFYTETADVPRPVFTDALAVHTWSELKTTRLTGQPLADKTVSSTQYPSATYTSTWEVNTAGELVIRHVRKSNGSVARSTRYIPIRWSGKNVTVLATTGGFSIVIVLQDVTQ